MTSRMFLCYVLLGLACGLLGDLVSAQATTASSRQHYRTVCYVAGWAHYRPDPVQFHPEDVDTSLCSHLIYAFAVLDSSGTHLQAGDTYRDVEMYQRLTALKREKPWLKVMLSVGGWTMGSVDFSTLVSREQNMHAFATSAIDYLHRYNFDGLDVDWEYPADRGSPAGDKQRFTQLLQILDKEFARDHHLTNRSRLLLTVATSPAPFRVQQSYQMAEIAQYVDFINLMTYDLHGGWDDRVGHHSPLYSATQDETDSVDFMINFILNTTIPRQKLNMGLAFYGHSYNLSDPTDAQIGSPIDGNGNGGETLKDPGVLAYYEVCKLLTEHNDTITDSGRLPGSQAPYVVDGNRWTGYDDVNSITEKVSYVMEHGLGGVFIWSIDMDDFHGICGGGHYPLMNAIKHQMHSAVIGRR